MNRVGEMHTGVAMSQMDAQAFQSWLEAESGAIFVPVGALEQHGPHLPMGTDAFLAERIATAVAESTGCLVAQPITYGYKSQQKSGGGDHLVGTTSLSAATLIGLTRNLVTAFFHQGVTRLVFVNGHYENYQFLYEGIDLALRDLGVEPGSGYSVVLLSYWDYVSEDTLDLVYPDGFPGWGIEHGGVLETSLMLHLAPQLVGLERAVDHPPATLQRFDRLPVLPGRTPTSGCLSSPARSNIEKGKLLFDQIVRDLTQDLARELHLSREVPEDQSAGVR